MIGWVKGDENRRGEEIEDWVHMKSAGSMILRLVQQYEDAPFKTQELFSKSRNDSQRWRLLGRDHEWELREGRVRAWKRHYSVNPMRKNGYCRLGRAAMLALQSSFVFSPGSTKVSPNGSMNFCQSSSFPNANCDLIKSTGIDTRYLKMAEKKKNTGEE